jgi:outer membrane protein OmpA-like peptidoglycan-associated protein
MMRSTVAAVVSLLAFATLDVATPRSADACGTHRTVTPPPTPKFVHRSSNPSRVLLVGTPPTRLTLDLEQAGHDVDITRDPNAAKHTGYRVVIVDDARQMAVAQARYPTATIYLRSGVVSEDLRFVEEHVRRVPVAAARPRFAVDGPRPQAPAKAMRTPPSPVRIAVQPPEPATQRATIAPIPAIPAIHDELTFTRGSALVGRSAALDTTLAALKATPSLRITVAGHADPSGSHDANLQLSLARAEAVRDYFVGNGIDASRIAVEAYGDAKLKYPATDGRNRRVAIDVAR